MDCKIDFILSRTVYILSSGGQDGKAPVLAEKGTIVAINLFALHHDKYLWGDDADMFRPQRWVNKRLMWELVPFLGVPRICPTQQQVLNQNVYLLVRLTRGFVRIENKGPVIDFVDAARTVTESKNRAKVAVFGGS